MLKVAFLGNLYHASLSLMAEFNNSDKYKVIPIVDSGLLNLSGFDTGIVPFKNLGKMFNARIISSVKPVYVNKILSEESPDIVIVRCWTPFANLNLSGTVFWKIESIQREHRDQPLATSTLLPSKPEQHIGFLTQNNLEIPFYKKLLPIPVGYFPRGVSKYWEKEYQKTESVMVTGTAAHVAKINSFKLLAKPLCENFGPDIVNVYVHCGRGSVGWAKNHFKPCYYAEEGPSIIGKHKIFISPVTTRFDPGILSHKTLQAMACKCLTITQHYDGVEDIIGKDGEYMVYADSPQEVVDKVRFYLSHDKEREAIAQRGYDFIHNEYNFTKLFENAMKSIGVF